MTTNNDSLAKSTDKASSDTHSGNQRKAYKSASNTDGWSSANSQSVPATDGQKPANKSAPDADIASNRSAADDWKIDDAAPWSPPDWSTSDTGDGRGPANQSAPDVDGWGTQVLGNRNRPNFGWSSTSKPNERKDNTWTDSVMSEGWGGEISYIAANIDALVGNY